MATYTVKAPDGKTITLEGPDGASQADVIAQAQRLYKPQAAPTPAPAPAPKPNSVEAYQQRWANMSPTQARGILQKFAGSVSPDDPRTQALAKIAGVKPPAVRAPESRAQRAGRAASAANAGKSNFLAAAAAGASRAMFGIPERIAARALETLPGAITGNYSDASYDDILAAVRAKGDAEMGRSTGGNVLGSILGAVTSGGGAGRLAGRVAQGAVASGAPAVQRAGNALQGLMTYGKGQTARNAGKAIVTGAAGGAAQSVGEGSDPVKGAAAGAGAAAALGTGFKAAQVVTRPFRDMLRLSSADRILRRLTSASREQLETRAREYRDATGAEPTLFELLPLADRNRVLKQAVVGRDAVVERASSAIRTRAENLGPEMATRTREILRPRREATQAQMRADLATARGGQNAASDAALTARASNSPTDLLDFRDEEARAIMAPFDNRRVVGSLNELYPSVPAGGRSRRRIATDPEVQAVIQAAAGVARRRPGGAGVNVGEITDMISTLRKDLDGGVIEAGTAQRAIDHLQGVLDQRVPEAGAAARQMADAWAARSRMAEGMEEGSRTRLRNAVQVGTNRTAARKVRNAYDSPEGDAGRGLGQGNRVLQNLEGSPEEALRATIDMARNSTGRQLRQNVGMDEGEAIMRAAQAQDASAQALSSASAKASAGGSEPASAESLVAALAGLNPASFLTTKVGAVRKLMDMTFIPENRARTMVDMIFSQDPAMTQRALAAVGNERNGAQFLRYMSGVAGQLAGSTEAQNPAPVELESEAAPVIQNSDGSIGPDPEGLDGEDPIGEGDSPYAGELQAIYDNESPELLDLIERVSGQESGGQQFDGEGNPITSSAGAIGIMQVMPGTAPEAAELAGVPWDEDAYYHDPAYNKLLGIAYLSEMLRRYDGDVERALAAYNAGPGAVDDAASRDGDWLSHLPAETQDYVQKLA